MLSFTPFATAHRVAENPRLFASPDVVSSSANTVPDRQSAIGTRHTTSPLEHSRPELSLRVDSGRLTAGRAGHQMSDLDH
jgi:hypothetical protein